MQVRPNELIANSAHAAQLHAQVHDNKPVDAPHIFVISLVFIIIIVIVIIIGSSNKLAYLHSHTYLNFSLFSLFLLMICHHLIWPFYTSVFLHFAFFFFVLPLS